MPSACHQMGRGLVLWGSVQKPCTFVFPVKRQATYCAEGECGGASTKEKNGFGGVYLCGDVLFLARWMAHSALAVMQHNAAVSQPPLVLAGGAWHGHSAPAAPARPHPGRGCPWPGFRAASPCQAASAGCGVKRTRSPSCVWGSSLWSHPFPPRQWGWSWKKGRPSALMRAGGSRPAAADNNLISNRGP